MCYRVAHEGQTETGEAGRGAGTAAEPERVSEAGKTGRVPRGNRARAAGGVAASAASFSHLVGSDDCRRVGDTRARRPLGVGTSATARAGRATAKPSGLGRPAGRPDLG